MWTQEHERQPKVERYRAKRGYPTDVGDWEWSLMEPLLPLAERTGRPRMINFGSVINALRYLGRTGCE